MSEGCPRDGSRPFGDPHFERPTGEPNTPNVFRAPIQSFFINHCVAADPSLSTPSSFQAEPHNTAVIRLLADSHAIITVEVYL